MGIKPVTEPTTEELKEIAKFFGCEFNTSKPKPGQDYMIGQIAAINKIINEKHIIRVSEFRYIGHNKWEKVPQSLGGT